MQFQQFLPKNTISVPTVQGTTKKPTTEAVDEQDPKRASLFFKTLHGTCCCSSNSKDTKLQSFGENKASQNIIQDEVLSGKLIFSFDGELSSTVNDQGSTIIFGMGFNTLELSMDEHKIVNFDDSKEVPPVVELIMGSALTLPVNSDEHKQSKPVVESPRLRRSCIFLLPLPSSRGVTFHPLAAAQGNERAARIVHSPSCPVDYSTKKTPKEKHLHRTRILWNIIYTCVAQSGQTKEEYVKQRNKKYVRQPVTSVLVDGYHWVPRLPSSKMEGIVLIEFERGHRPAGRPLVPPPRPLKLTSVIVKPKEAEIRRPVDVKGKRPKSPEKRFFPKRTKLEILPPPPRTSKFILQLQRVPACTPLAPIDLMDAHVSTPVVTVDSASTTSLVHVPVITSAAVPVDVPQDLCVIPRLPNQVFKDLTLPDVGAITLQAPNSPLKVCVPHPAKDPTLLITNPGTIEEERNDQDQKMTDKPASKPQPDPNPKLTKIISKLYSEELFDMAEYKGDRPGRSGIVPGRSVDGTSQRASSWKINYHPEKSSQADQFSAKDREHRPEDRPADYDTQGQVWEVDLDASQEDVEPLPSPVAKENTIKHGKENRDDFVERKCVDERCIRVADSGVKTLSSILLSNFYFALSRAKGSFNEIEFLDSDSLSRNDDLMPMVSVDTALVCLPEDIEQVQLRGDISRRSSSLPILEECEQLKVLCLYLESVNSGRSNSLPALEECEQLKVLCLYLESVNSGRDLWVWRVGSGGSKKAGDGSPSRIGAARGKGKARDPVRSGSDGAVEGRWEIKTRGADLRGALQSASNGSLGSGKAKVGNSPQKAIGAELQCSDMRVSVNPAFSPAKSAMEMDMGEPVLEEQAEEEMFDVDAAMPRHPRSLAISPDVAAWGNEVLNSVAGGSVSPASAMDVAREDASGEPEIGAESPDVNMGTSCPLHAYENAGSGKSSVSCEVPQAANSPSSGPFCPRRMDNPWRRPEHIPVNRPGDINALAEDGATIDLNLDRRLSGYGGGDRRSPPRSGGGGDGGTTGGERRQSGIGSGGSKKAGDGSPCRSGAARGKGKARDPVRSGSEGAVEGRWEIKTRGADLRGTLQSASSGSIRSGKAKVGSSPQKAPGADLHCSDMRVSVNPAFSPAKTSMEMDLGEPVSDVQDEEEMFDVDAAMPRHPRSLAVCPDVEAWSNEVLNSTAGGSGSPASAMDVARESASGEPEIGAGTPDVNMGTNCPPHVCDNAGSGKSSVCCEVPQAANSPPLGPFCPRRAGAVGQLHDRPEDGMEFCLGRSDGVLPRKQKKALGGVSGGGDASPSVCL
ncbi:hypothetical protein MA16_Dca022367 [Dendrobium catenatum]|uniref:Uncharacterized protein n=1 Tax=Dendrobium catenatum TaxID=906689 RepID=A0A2I0VVF8_9ASPA|nr:hypothetical protein MA16_Dca022367 [Dendrobium catenatum]